MGVVIGSTNVVEATPTITAGAYSTGDLVGAKITLTGAVVSALTRPSGIVHSVVLTDLAAQSADYDVVFFDTDPSNTTFTDNAAFAPADADLINVIGVAQLTTHSAFSDNGVSFAFGTNIPFKITDTSTNALYAALVVRAAPTYASTSDLTLKVTVLQD